jgi:hypothetical protein
MIRYSSRTVTNRSCSSQAKPQLTAPCVKFWHGTRSTASARAQGPTKYRSTTAVAVGADDDALGGVPCGCIDPSVVLVLAVAGHEVDDTRLGRNPVA